MHEDQTFHQTALASRLRLTAMLVALIGGLAVLVMKFYAAHIAASAALRSDALEGTVNVLAAAFGLGSLFFSEKPADQDHPYGHGKIEYFAQAFEGGLISLAGFLIFVDTMGRLIHHENLSNLGLGLQISIFSGLINGVMGFGIYFTGKKYHSQILVADGIHLLADLITTIVLAIGLTLVMMTGWEWIDPLLAFGVALFLFRTGYKLVEESSKTLLDAEDPEMIKLVVKYLNELPRENIITAHEMKVQKFGRDKHVDIHLVVPEFLSVKEAHQLTDPFAISLSRKLGHGSVVHTHTDPCERKYCVNCPVEPCAVRAKAFQHQEKFTPENVTRLGPI